MVGFQASGLRGLRIVLVNCAGELFSIAYRLYRKKRKARGKGVVPGFSPVA